MYLKPLLFWVMVCLGFFLVVSGVSYFVRSDAYGLPGVQDGVIRVGFPFVMFETGGFSHHVLFSWPSAFKDLALAAGATAFLALISKWKKDLNKAGL